jgi:hypothetical protein
LDTSSFLSHVLPKQGFKFIAIKRGDDKPWIHKPTQAFSVAADIAIQADERGEAAYHACASYVAASVETGEFYENGKPKRRYRTQDNAGWAKSFWLDLDCGPNKDYPDARTAIADVFRLCNETGLPRPLLVSSGWGVHCYWVQSEDIPAAQWRRIAPIYRAVLDHYGIKHDPSRTTDIASILRPPGTTNRKRADSPKTVKVLGAVPPKIEPAAFAKQLVELYKRHSLKIQALPTKRFDASGGVNSDLVAGTEYPPSSAHEIANHCQQLRDFRDAAGDVAEPLWYPMLGLIKRTTEGEELCHEWSKGHPEYNAKKTQEKIDQWEVGPPTCERLEKLRPEGCAGCRFKSKVKSPIQLGIVVPESAPIEEETAEDSPDVVDKVPDLPPRVSARFAWNGTQLVEYKKNEEGVRDAVPFMDCFLWAETHHRKNHVGTTWVYRDRPGRYKRFELAAECIATGGRELFAALGREGVIAINGGKRSLETYITEWFSALKATTEEVNSYHTFGWQKDGGFLLGETLYTADGPKEVRVTGDAQGYTGAFTEEGTAEDWANGVEAAYGLPGSEQYQWMLGCAFGAPLVKLLGSGIAGCVINGYSAESGLGKSTAAKIGLSLYGNPERLMLSKQQATTKGLFAYTGMMGSLPVLLDETTNVKGLELSDLVYTFSQGSGRIGAMGDGSLRTNVYGWSTLMMSTSNRSMQSTLAASKANATPEIARVFEYKFTKIPGQRSKIEADRIFNRAAGTWGAAGRLYIEYITRNQAKVRALLDRTREMLSEKAGLRADERFWGAGMTTIIAGLLIGKKLGLIKFDVPNLTKWAIRQVVSMRQLIGENETSVMEQFGTMLNQISAGLLVTDKEGDARSPTGKALVTHAPRGEITGRVVTISNTLYLPVSVIREWCSENQADYRQMTSELILRSWAVLHERPYSLGRGTNDYPTAPTRCYKINLALVGGEMDTGLSNVVAMKAA